MNIHIHVNVQSIQHPIFMQDIPFLILFLHVHVHVYISMCICTNTFTCTYMYLCTWMCICTCTYHILRSDIHVMHSVCTTCIRTCISWCVWVCGHFHGTHMYMYTCVHVCGMVSTVLFVWALSSATLCSLPDCEGLSCWRQGQQRHIVFYMHDTTHEYSIPLYECLLEL